MPVEKWSESIVVAHLGDDPQFTEDLHAMEIPPGEFRPNAVLDFAGVTFVNSSNISSLLKLRKAMILDDAHLVLCNIRNEVWGTFLVTGLDNIFAFSDNVTTALATVQMNGPRA